jgi:hypothetical protein
MLSGSLRRVARFLGSIVHSRSVAVVVALRMSRGRHNRHRRRKKVFRITIPVNLTDGYTAAIAYRPADLLDLAATAVSAFERRLRFGSGLPPGCVLRTASANISRSSALVFGGSRLMDACQLAMDSMWGFRETIKPPLTVKAQVTDGSAN